MEKNAIVLIAQGASNAGWRSPTYKILLPHKIIKKQQGKKTCSGGYMLQSYDCQNTPPASTQDCIILPLENDCDIQLPYLPSFKWFI